MKIRIQNIGKISSADVEIQSITVIGGENDTGKSTVGKALLTVYNSFCKVQERTRKAKERGVINVLNKMARDGARKLRNESTYITEMASLLIHSFENGISDREKLIHCINDLWNEKMGGEGLLITDELIQNNNGLPYYLESLFDILNLTQERYRNNNLERRLVSEFGALPKNFYTQEESFIEIIMQSDVIRAKINESEIDTNGELEFTSEAVYIDDTSILDSNFQTMDFRNMPSRKIALISSLFTLKEENNANDENDEAADIVAANRFNRIRDNLNDVCPGKVVVSNSGISYQKDDLSRPIKSVGLSEGLKSFIILKTLLLNRTIDTDGVLILDEPEIHVHPAWQIRLAELIVSIQKEFGLHILITTHSPYFLEAIEVFSEKYGISETCKYYIAENTFPECTASITDITENTEVIYQKLSMPFQELEDERYNSND